LLDDVNFAFTFVLIVVLQLTAIVFWLHVTLSLLAASAVLPDDGITKHPIIITSVIMIAKMVRLLFVSIVYPP
jgi:hypothetical protein